MIVMKFGGTSVGDASRIRNVAKLVKSYFGRKPVVVVSAVTKVTDALTKLASEAAQGKGDSTFASIKEMHHGILKELKLSNSLLEKDFQQLEEIFKHTKSLNHMDAAVMDNFQSFGEQLSSKIVAAQLNSIGVNAKAFNAWELGLFTDDEHGNAKPLPKSYASINKSIKALKVIPVITGFIGKADDGSITTLGRGGSDYSAAVIGSAIKAEEIQIWTDVNGVMSTDPRIISSAKTIPEVSFAEAAELAYFGARVLHPKTILPAMEKNIPLKVLNSFEPENKGTTILPKGVRSKQTVKAIASKKNITLINVASTRMLGAYGFLAILFGVFAKYKKSVDVISTSEVSVSLTVENGENLEQILAELRGIGDVSVLKNKAIICAVGEGMKNALDIVGKTFTTLAEHNINVEMISQGASKINVTFIVDEHDADKAVKILHKTYFR